MSERYQTLMRTRCPDCSTVFRVTSEQLRLKLGKVRCGQCNAVFNAFDALITADAEPEPKVASFSGETSALQNESAAEGFAPNFLNEPEPEPEPEPEFVTRLERSESIEESTLAAREAGLVAARDLSGTPAYNRWAEGTLAGSSLGGFSHETSKSVMWPYVLVVLLLTVALIVQLLFYFKTELVQRMPGLQEFYEAVAVDVPLPRNSELVTIETSDLQSDNARGLLVLQAILHNRAAYDQAWPALELTLTDTQDAVLARRVLSVDDYLPSAAKTPVFSANAELAVRLWIEAKEVGAAGYRLYIFYP